MRKIVRKLILAFTLMAVTTTSWTDSAEARRRRRRHRAKRAPIINEKKLFERIGGQKRLAEIVEEWMRLNLADARTTAVFTDLTNTPAKLTKERRELANHLCELADGPCSVKADPAKKAGVKLGETQFLVFGDNLFKSMQKFGVPEREKNELLGRLGEAKSDFTESKAQTGDQDA